MCKKVAHASLQVWHCILENHFFKERFLTVHLFFVLFSLQFHEAPTMVGVKMFQTVCKRMLCEHSLYLALF